MPRPLRLIVSLLLAAAPTAAEELSFDDLPATNSNAPVLSEEYAHLGAHFVATDDGAVWSGLSAGDPGGWGLEGSNGSNFLGFNGASYGLGVVFDGPVRDVKVDVARSLGSRAGDGFVLRGYRSGAMVEERSVWLGEVNAWSTVELAAEVDALDWVGVGVGTRRHPFGVDNLRWSAELPTLDVAIDVRPGSPHNRINPFARGVVAVALLGDAELDATQVEIESLAFGPDGAPAVHSLRRDVDGDGFLDLVSFHRIARTGIAAGDAEACLVGRTSEGNPFAGCEAVDGAPLRWLEEHAAAERSRRASRP